MKVFSDDGMDYDASERRRFGDEDDDADSLSSPPPLRGRSAGAAGREGGRAGSHSARGTGTSKGRFAARREPLTIEGELVAKSTGTTSAYSVGDRVFHIKFGYGSVRGVEGNKLTVSFDKAGEKKVLDSFVEKQG